MSGMEAPEGWASAATLDSVKFTDLARVELTKLPC